MKPLRILVADDHEVVRRGLRTILETQTDWVVAGEAGNGRQAVELAATLKPDIIIMDINMPELNGLEATRQIMKSESSSQILILTMHDSEQLIREVLRSGARGYVLKSDAGNDLVAAVTALQNKKVFFTSRVTELFLEAYLNRKPEQEQESFDPITVLTAREREILQLLAEGKSNKEVAALLSLSIKTVETHRSRIMDKLQLESVADLVRFAVRNNIISA